MTALFGAAGGCAALAVAGAREWAEPHAARLVAAGAAYLAGVIAPTIAFHVPRNDALERLDPDAPGTASAWRAHLRPWTAGNHIRTLAGIGAAMSLADALRVG